MTGPRGRRRGETCPACGRSIDRREAIEYDKDGEKWERRGKQLEYLCSPCHDELTLVPRDDLEATLVDIGAGRCDRETFFRRYREAVGGRRGRHGDS